jgi:dipeptide/tripeptide permease
MSAAEVLISVNGLSFAYSQSPPSAKTVLQSFWSMNAVCGNIIIIIIVKVNAALKTEQTKEYMFVMILTSVVTLIFIGLAYNYKDPMATSTNVTAKERRKTIDEEDIDDERRLNLMNLGSIISIR